MEAKPGHSSIKEFHFHVYWFQNSSKAGAFFQGFQCPVCPHPTTILEREAIAFKEALVSRVKSKEIIVVCDGVDERILPSLSSAIPKVNFAPIGPHPCGSYEVRKG